MNRLGRHERMADDADNCEDGRDGRPEEQEARDVLADLVEAELVDAQTAQEGGREDGITRRHNRQFSVASCGYGRQAVTAGQSFMPGMRSPGRPVIQPLSRTES